MASQNILDFDRLLSPISDDNPCGADLRWEPVYQEIKDARPKDDRDAFGLDSPVIANWAPVVDLTSDALATQSKDLMLAAWLAEALVHQYGFAGFRDGLKLINGLLEDWWDGLYPLPDGEDLEPRGAAFVSDKRGSRSAATRVVERGAFGPRCRGNFFLELLARPAAIAERTGRRVCGAGRRGCREDAKVRRGCLASDIRLCQRPVRGLKGRARGASAVQPQSGHALKDAAQARPSCGPPWKNACSGLATFSRTRADLPRRPRAKMARANRTANRQDRPRDLSARATMPSAGWPKSRPICGSGNRRVPSIFWSSEPWHGAACPSINCWAS